MMHYIQDHTSIPVPFILHWGTKKESPLQIVPSIIMEYINHETDMGAVLNTPSFGKDDRPILDPDIDPEKLEMLYRQLAGIALQPSRLEFPLIGSIEQDEAQDTWSVIRRPLSMHMNELVRLGTLPRAKLPNSTYASSADYLSALSKLNIDHFSNQRNDSIESPSDLRDGCFNGLRTRGELLRPKMKQDPFDYTAMI